MSDQNGRDNEAMRARMDERLEAMHREIKAMQAREKIRDGIYRYCTAVDRCDLELLKSCYHSDADDVHARTFCGKAMDFADYIIPQMKRLFSTQHSISNISIDLRDNRAFVQSQFRGLHRLNLDDSDSTQGYIELDTRGRYLDIWEDRSGDWRISFRYLANDGNILRILKDQAPLEHTELSGKPSKEDPYYLGFDIARHKPANFSGIDVAGLLRSMAKDKRT